MAWPLWDGWGRPVGTGRGPATFLPCFPCGSAGTSTSGFSSARKLDPPLLHVEAWDVALRPTCCPCPSPPACSSLFLHPPHPRPVFSLLFFQTNPSGFCLPGGVCPGLPLVGSVQGPPLCMPGPRCGLRHYKGPGFPCERSSVRFHPHPPQRGLPPGSAA